MVSRIDLELFVSYPVAQLDNAIIAYARTYLLKVAIQCSWGLCQQRCLAVAINTSNT